jgi:hypothetical protein
MNSRGALSLTASQSLLLPDATLLLWPDNLYQDHTPPHYQPHVKPCGTQPASALRIHDRAANAAQGVASTDDAPQLTAHRNKCTIVA